jgi:asparagine synthase (glutamine-hydrolysing)
MAWGLEARVPFLDKEFVNLCIDIHKDLKGTMNFTTDPKMEKYVIRKAFDINDENGNPVYLPRDVLWRQKEQFSDGVGYNWIDTLKEFTQSQVKNDPEMLSRYHNRFITYQFNTPESMEAFYYREIFERFYPLRATTVKKWVPKTEWEGVGNDPSGRAQSTHDNKL